jgi:hypothetical protein
MKEDQQPESERMRAVRVAAEKNLTDGPPVFEAEALKQIAFVIRINHGKMEMHYEFGTSETTLTATKRPSRRESPAKMREAYRRAFGKLLRSVAKDLERICDSGAPGSISIAIKLDQATGMPKDAEIQTSYKFDVEPGDAGPD